MIHSALMPYLHLIEQSKRPERGADEECSARAAKLQRREKKKKKENAHKRKQKRRRVKWEAEGM